MWVLVFEAPYFVLGSPPGRATRNGGQESGVASPDIFVEKSKPGVDQPVRHLYDT